MTELQNSVWNDSPEQPFMPAQKYYIFTKNCNNVFLTKKYNRIRAKSPHILGKYQITDIDNRPLSDNKSQVILQKAKIIRYLLPIITVISKFDKAELINRENLTDTDFANESELTPELLKLIDTKYRTLESKDSEELENIEIDLNVTQINQTVKLEEPSSDDMMEDNLELGVKEVKNKSVNNITTSNSSPKHLIPCWTESSDPNQSFFNLLNYINALRRAKDLGVFKSDKLLITSSLNVSDKQHLFSLMPPQAADDLDEFIRYLNSAFGRSDTEIRRNLRNLKQSPSERPVVWLGKCISFYFSSFGESPKTLEEIKGNKKERLDIISLFTEGLANQQVKQMLKSKLSSVEFSDLAKATQEIEDSLLDANNNVSVNNISSMFQSTPLDTAYPSDDKIAELERKFAIHAIDFKKHQKKFNKQTNKFNKYQKNQKAQAKGKKESQTKENPKFKPKAKSTCDCGIPVICQFCGKKGHESKSCFQLQDLLAQ